MLSKLTTDMANISKLPTTVVGQAATLKAEFDKAGNEQIKTYINDTLTTEIDTEITNINNGLTDHKNDKNNPHDVTKSQVELGNVDNVKQATKEEFDLHTSNKGNPHEVKKAQLGLGSVEDGAQINIIEDVKVNNTSLNIVEKAVNIPIDSYINNLFKSVSYSSSDGKMTFTAYNNSITVIDLPLELIVSDGHYESGQIILTLANGDTIDIPIGDLISELYTKDEVDILLSNYFTKAETNSALALKVDKVTSKGLSTNDFTTTEKNKLSNLRIIDLGIKKLSALEQYTTDEMYIVYLDGYDYAIMSVDERDGRVYQTFFFLGVKTTTMGKMFYRIKDGGVWGNLNYKGTVSVEDFTTALKTKLTDLPTNTTLNTSLSTKVDKTHQNLLTQNIKGTTQSIAFNDDDSVYKIHHKTGGIVIREDIFTYTNNLITEVRTLNTLETITFKYHLDTLETEVI